MTLTLRDALLDSAVSASSQEITITCGSHEAKDVILDFLTGEALEQQHELLVFLAIWAVQFQNDHKLNGLHPLHYDLMKKYGARMVDFLKATNAAPLTSGNEDKP